MRRDAEISVFTAVWDFGNIFKGRFKVNFIYGIHCIHLFSIIIEAVICIYRIYRKRGVKSGSFGGSLTKRLKKWGFGFESFFRINLTKYYNCVIIRV